MITNVPLLNANEIAFDKMSLNEKMESIDKQLLDQTTSLDLDSLIKTPVDLDSTYTFEQLADEYGFTADSYQVVTEDGYELKMFRLR